MVKIKKKTLYGIGIGLVVIAGIFLYSSSVTRYVDPPIGIRGHIEAWPPSNLVAEPIPINIQKHILEHAANGQERGILIQYNCKDCSDLVTKLAMIQQKHGGRVYVAPYYEVDSLIVLTSYGRIEKLDEFDQERIERFILRTPKSPLQ